MPRRFALYAPLALMALVLLAGQVTAQAPIDPWDTDWLPTDRAGQRALDAALDALLEETGLAGQGSTIRAHAQEYGVNPAFVLAMFRKEAGFAAPGTLAHDNRNPFNIVATGECHGEPAGTACSGFYGEVSTDGRFGVYARMEDGIKAAFWLLDREYRPLTLEGIISRACPPVECDVQKYVGLTGGWAADYRAHLEAAIRPIPDFVGQIVDDGSDASPALGFALRGPANYWHEATTGYSNHAWWTHNNESGVENVAAWSLNVDRPGPYTAYAYIPLEHATTRSARYTVRCPGDDVQAAIDQSAHRNQWVRLGRVTCGEAGTLTVELVDETGEPSVSRQIAVDAVGVRYEGQEEETNNTPVADGRPAESNPPPQSPLPSPDSEPPPPHRGAKERTQPLAPPKDESGEDVPVRSPTVGLQTLREHVEDVSGLPVALVLAAWVWHTLYPAQTGLYALPICGIINRYSYRVIHPPRSAQ